MATYDRAAQATELIYDVARLNNNAWETIQRIKALRDKLVALTVTEQNAIRAAVADMGYDSAEIEAMLGDWNQMHASGVSLGIVMVEPPR